MKKTVLALLTTMLLVTGLRAQTLYDAYLFDTWVDTNAWITLDSDAVILIAPPPSPNGIRNNGRSMVTNIGFPFILAGVEHTKFSVNVYGTLRLGNTQVLPSNSGVTPLNAVGQNLPKIEPFGGRMCMDSSSRMLSATVGDSGNRVCVVEMRLATYNTPRAKLSAQVQLFEATGEVRIVYGPTTGDTLPMAMQNGIAASSTDVVFIDMVANEAFFSEGGISQTNPMGMWPDEGRVYSFMVNPDYCPRPSAVSMTNSNPDSLTLLWSGDGSQYRLYIPDADIDSLVSDTTVTLSGLYDTTTYSGTLQSVCPSGTSNSVAFSFTTAISPAHAPLFSCNFEASDAIDVWEQRWVTSDGGTWSRVSDNTRPVGNRWTARCQSGSLNPTNTWLIMPNITLPADADGYFLRWKQRVVDNMGFNPTFDVRLAAATDTIADGAPTSAYSTILFTMTGSTSGYESHQVSLAQYCGQTVRIAFVDNDSYGWSSMYIDDIDIVPTYRPEITFTAPDSVEVGDTLQLTATVWQGYTTGMTVEWHSTMEALGEASLTSDSLQATIVYNTDGVDTITVTAIGQYGNRSATAIIQVSDPLRFVVPHTALTADVTRATVFDTVGFKVTLTGGSASGLYHDWWSAMVSRGDALLSTAASDDSVYIVYLAPGQDTVVVHTVNAYGQSDDTVTLTICPVQDTLPWVVDFSNDFPCWQVLEGAFEVDNNGYLDFIGFGPTTVASPSVYVPDDGNVVLEYDCAYSFFYGSTQVMVTTDMITFDTLGVFPFVTGTHPSTRIPLNAYADQHIRLVFKATGEFLHYYLFNVSVRYSFDPVVSLTADDGYFPGTPMTLTANLLEGDTNGITYSFTSAKAQNGEATLIQDSSAQATLICYTGGPDTVTVVVTNAYGSDTAWNVVNVKPCDTVDALLWTENFDNNYTCWWQPAGSRWIRPDDSSYTLAMVINVWMPTDSWLVSRAITLPTLPIGANDELLLCWDATTQINDTHSYCVMVTTAADYRDLGAYDTLIAIDTVHPDYSVGWSTMRARLSAYAGQTVHLAFRYTTEAWEPNGQLPGILMIDNVRIIDTLFVPPTPPVPDTVWRTVSVTANVDAVCEPYGSGVYADSSMVEIGYMMTDIATDGGHWEFLGWNDGGMGNPRNLFVTSDTAIVALFQWVDDSVGIKEVENSKLKIEFYPNPAHGDVTVSVSEPSVLTVIDLTGRVVIPFIAINTSYLISHTSLTPGAYFVRVTTRGNTIVKKLIIK